MKKTKMALSQLKSIIEKRVVNLNGVSVEAENNVNYVFSERGKEFSCEIHFDEDGDLFFTKVCGQVSKHTDCMYYYNQDLCELEAMYTWLRNSFNFDIDMAYLDMSEEESFYEFCLSEFFGILTFPKKIVKLLSPAKKVLVYIAKSESRSF